MTLYARTLTTLALLTTALLLSSGLAADYTLRAGHVYTADSVPHQALERFADLVTERSDGAIEVELFPGGQMGSDPELQEAVALGTLELIVTGASMIDRYAPAYTMIGAPYVIRDWEHLQAVLDGDIGQELSDTMAGQGVVLAGYSKRGNRHLTANEPIRAPADLQGYKLRVPNNRGQLAVWSAIGANPTPMAWGEVYTSLQTGVIDAQENPFAILASYSIAEVQDYVMLTGHLTNPYFYGMSASALDRMDDATRDLVLSALDEALAYGTELQDQADAGYVAQLEEAGMTFVEDIDLDAFIAAAQEGHAQLLADLPSEAAAIYQRIVDTQ